MLYWSWLFVLGGGCMEPAVAGVRRQENQTGRHRRPVQILHHGARPPQLDGRHQPTNQESRETQVSTVPLSLLFLLSYLYFLMGSARSETMLVCNGNDDPVLKGAIL